MSDFGLEHGKHSGTGLRYLEEISTQSVVNQKGDDSCTVLYMRQVSRDAGLEFGEAEPVIRIDVVPGFGSTATDAARVLDELHSRLGCRAGTSPGGDPNPIQPRPGISFLPIDRGTIHSVIVGSLKDDVVRVRDPQGSLALDWDSESE